MKGFRMLGSVSNEPARHGLLNLAAKFPALYTKAMARNGGSFAAARVMYRSGQQQEAEEATNSQSPNTVTLYSKFTKELTFENSRQRAAHAAAAARKEADARAVLRTSFPTAFQAAEARDDGVLSNRDARRVVHAEEAKHEQAAAWSPPQTLIDGFGNKAVKIGDKAIKKEKEGEKEEWSQPLLLGKHTHEDTHEDTRKDTHKHTHKDKARTTNLAQLQEGRVTLARDEAEQENDAKVAAAALAKEEAAVRAARKEEQHARLAREKEEARARDAREREAQEKERESRAKRSRQALARRKEHLKGHRELDRDHVPSNKDGGGGGRLSVKEAVADLLAESFFHPAAAKASLLKSLLYSAFNIVNVLGH